jgi:hypothetical protein
VQREEEDEDEDEEGEELELRIPGSFSFENVGGGAAQGAMGCEFGQPVRCGQSLKFNAGIIDYISCPKIWPCLVRTGVRKCWIK